MENTNTNEYFEPYLIFSGVVLSAIIILTPIYCLFDININANQHIICAIGFCMFIIIAECMRVFEDTICRKMSEYHKIINDKTDVIDKQHKRIIILERVINENVLSPGKPMKTHKFVKKQLKRHFIRDNIKDALNELNIVFSNQFKNA